MGKLTDLSPEILALIVQRYESILLWKCGDKRLMTLLAHGGAYSVDLLDWLKDTTSRFPKCLGAFVGMRHLRISRGRSRLMNAEDFGEALKALPTTLETLVLRCKDAILAFRRKESDSLTSLFDNCKSMPEKSVEMFEGSPKASIWSVKKKFPRLKTLILGQGISIFSSDDLLELPATITSMSAHFDTTDPAAYANLPASIETLDYEDSPREVDVNLLALLPRTLTSLPFLLNLSIPAEKWALLPPLLRDARISTEWEPQIARFCPPLLNNLSIRFPSGHSALKSPEEYHSLLESLPRSLTALKIVFNQPPIISARQGPHLTDSFHWDSLSALPRTLNTLHLFTLVDWGSVNSDSSSSSSSSLPSIQVLPASLTDLLLTTSEFFTSPVASVAMRGLTNLQILTLRRSQLFQRRTARVIPIPTNGDGPVARRVIPQQIMERKCTFDWSILSCLPPSLTDLTLTGPEVSNNGVSQEAFEMLPNNLQSLSIEFIICLQPSSILALPRSLTSLYLKAVLTLDILLASQLPPSLEMLMMDNADIHSDALPLLPRSLTFLHLKKITLPKKVGLTSTTLQDREIEEEEKRGNESIDTILFIDTKGLPPRLSHLQIEAINRKEALKGLPERLTSLTIPTIPSTALSSLPHQLLVLKSIVTGPTRDGDLLQMPRSLTEWAGYVEDRTLLKSPDDLFDWLPPRLQTYEGPQYSKKRRLRQISLELDPIQTPDPRILGRG